MNDYKTKIKTRNLIAVDPLTLDTVRKAMPNMSDRTRFDTLWKFNIIRWDFLLGEKFEERKKRREIRSKFNKRIL